MTGENKEGEKKGLAKAIKVECLNYALTVGLG